MEHRYFVLNKPYNMVSQFVSSHKVPLLGEIDFPFPEGTHAIGRLDINSEGLLILTTNKRVTKLLFESKVPHERTYLVNARYPISDEQLDELRNGVPIVVEGGNYYTTRPCEVERVSDPGSLFNYVQRGRDYGPDTWVLITITEGKFRQVRKMISALNNQVRRLVRTSIEDMLLGQLEPGAVRELEEVEFFRLLKIDNWRSV